MEPTALPGQGKRRKRLLARITAASALVAGAALLSVAGLYTYWRVTSGADSEHFNFEPDPAHLSSVSGVDFEGQHASLVSLYPGSHINPRYWDDPSWAGPEPFGAPGIPDDFTPVSPRDPIAARAAGAQPTRIIIPAIGLSSHVSELQLVDLGDQSAYQTPDNTVGHIPGTPLPGEIGNGYYFGHYESIGLGEGNVFHRLPEIASLIRNDPVDIFVQTDLGEYMYRVRATRQVHQSDLTLEPSDTARITLVTCWPTRIYDHRVLVIAELIAVKYQV